MQLYKPDQWLWHQMLSGINQDNCLDSLSVFLEF